MYSVYQNQAAAAYSSLYFFFLQYSSIKIFFTLFSGTVKPRRLKLGTHVDSGWMYTRIRLLLLLIHPFIFYFFFLQYSSIKIFFTLFSGTLRPRRLKLGAHVDKGWMYLVYQNQGLLHICCSIFFIFLSLQFSNIQMFLSHLSQELRGLEG